MSYHNGLHLNTRPATYIECSELISQRRVFDILMVQRSD